MLERVSACLEPAAQTLFKGFEGPTRSTRTLPRAFWRHTTDSTGPAPWWPAYLVDIRRAAELRHHGEKHNEWARGNAMQYNTSTFLPFIPPALESSDVTSPRPSRPYAGPGGRRHISKRARQLDRGIAKATEHETAISDRGATPKISRDLVSYTLRNKEKLKDNQLSPTSSGYHIKAGQVTKKPCTDKNPTEHLQDLLRASGEPKYGEAWQIYISLEEQAGFARAVLRYMSNSKSPMNLRRALQAYHIVEIENRSHLTYESAVRAATGLKNYTLAATVNREALIRNLGRESSQFLIGHYIKGGLWNAAVSAIETIVKSYSPLSDPLKMSEFQKWRILQKNDMLKVAATMVDLPQELLVLCERMRRDNAVFARRRPQLEELADYLLSTVLGSPDIMTVITGNGLLALFQAYHELGLLKLRHYLTALATLHKMSEARNRIQLAVMIYRNMRWRFPDESLPKFVYGTMISICSDAKYPPNAFEFLLESFTEMHGRPDPLAYQKVMSVCARQGYATYVEELFVRLSKDHNTPRDLACYTPLLYAYAKLGDVANTKRWFDRLSRLADLYPGSSLVPNTYCWNILLLAYVKANRHRDAFKVFKEMGEKKIRTDSHTFGTLMSICSNAGDSRALHELVDLARLYNVPGTTPMIDTLVHSYCLNDEVDEAVSLIEATTKMNLPGSSTRMWNILLRHHAFKGDSDALLKIQERMREAGVKPDGMTYAALMTALVVIGKTKDAAQILRSLHFSQNLTATLFHYSIVLHGYAQEGNRDMATVIYNEITERFPRPSPSARLSMLHLQSKRDSAISWNEKSQKALRTVDEQATHPTPQVLAQCHAIEFLADVLLETVPADLASNDPQPGFQRRHVGEALPSIYMEFLVSVLNSASSFEKAEKLLLHYQALIKASYLNRTQKAEQSIQLLSAHMLGCIRQAMWGRVDELWKQIVSQAISSAREHLPLLQVGNENKGETAGQETSAMVTVQASSTGSSSSGNAFLIPSTDPLSSEIFRHMIQISGDEDLLGQASLQILSAQRFILSRPLSQYMQALSSQGKHIALKALVHKLENVGFELTSKNWNTYVQVLTKSPDPVMQKLAFVTFERKLLPGKPDWMAIRRGRLLNISRSPSNSKLILDRQKTLAPGELRPTYFTMVYLATAFLKSCRRSEQGERDFSVRDLRNSAPGTVDLVQRLPYLRDRIQGVLLRGREIKGDPIKRPREPQRPDRSGLRGSRAPFDHIPLDHILEIESFIAPEMRRSLATKEIALQVGERVEGQIVRTPIVLARKGSNETEQQYKKRIRAEERTRHKIIEQIGEEARKEEPLVISSMLRGEPHVDALSFRSEQESRNPGLQDERDNHSEQGSRRRSEKLPVDEIGHVRQLAIQAEEPSFTAVFGAQPTLRRRRVLPGLVEKKDKVAIHRDPETYSSLVDFKPRKRQTRKQRLAFPIRRKRAEAQKIRLRKERNAIAKEINQRQKREMKRMTYGNQGQIDGDAGFLDAHLVDVQQGEKLRIVNGEFGYQQR